MATIFDPENQEQGTQAPVSASGQPLQTVATAAPQPTSSMASPEKRQGSGRFTNLQKYIQANQGAGQRIAGQIGSGIQKQVGKEQQQAQDYYSKLGQAVSQAQQTAQQGAGFTQQLRDIGQTISQSGYQAPQTQVPGQAPIRQETGLEAIQQFTQNPQFKQFQDIQSGRAINEQLLGLRQQQASREAQDYLSQIQQAQQQIGSEGGRFDLLRQTFGGTARPGYTTGQQRLDQLLLTGQLGGLQQQLNPQAQQARELAKLATGQAGEVSRLATQERGIMGDIQSQARANEQAYLDMLKSYIDPTQQARQAEYEALEQTIQQFRQPQSGQVGTTVVPRFTEQQLQNLGVTAGQGVYNVFDNIRSAQDIAQRGRIAETAQDVASQADVARYQALADILGASPQERAITQASDIGAAYTAREGEAGLASRLAQAEQAFQQSAGRDLTATAAAKNPRGFTTRGSAQANIMDLLQQGRPGIQNLTSTYDSTKSGYGQEENVLRQQLARQAQTDVWKQFEDFLKQQNYAQTLGGTRARPYETGKLGTEELYPTMGK